MCTAAFVLKKKLTGNTIPCSEFIFVYYINIVNIVMSFMLEKFIPVPSTPH